MKRLTYILCILSVTLFSTSCTDFLEGIGNGDSSEDIVFATSLEDLNNAPMTRSVGDYTIMEMTDWVDSADTKTTTRAAINESLSGYASIYAYQYDEAFNATDYSRYLENKKYQFTADGTLEQTEGYDYWSKITKDKVFFCSYAPYYEGTGTNPIQPAVYPLVDNMPTADSKPGVTYTVPTDVKNQTDVLYASTEVAGDYKQSVEFTYRHALTAIQFKMGFACKVKSISIQNVNTKGTFTFAKAESGNVWEESNTSGNYTISFGDAGTAFAAGDILTDGENTLMLIPQSFASDATARVVLTYIDGDTEKTISASLANSSWGMGKKIVYTLYNTPQTQTFVYFDLAAANVSITASSYSGAVYVTSADGTSTTATDVKADGLTADQIAKTKFYIYQSSTNTESVGYKTKTGIQLTTGEDAASIIKNNPERCRVPNYKALEFNGRSWGNYITNNKDVVTVLKAWNSNISTTGRTANTTSLITVSGASTFDVTIDNLYMTKTNGQTGGPIEFKPTSGGTMNLKLKGDNRLNNIYYLSTSDGKGYLNITSSEGDGAKSGTMTIGSFNLNKFTDTKVSSDCVALIGPHSGQAEYGLSFKGGTVFAGIVPQTNRVWKSRRSVTFPVGIGGGANAFGQINITGGRLTAVSNGTSTAIGGGGGYNSSNGSGNVTITGGETYAYAFGVYSIDDTGADDGARQGMPRRGFVPTTAIGGPSTFSEDQTKTSTVTITGGYVYAESLGGTAIGGGSSRLGTGSPATISISGTANVVAKSISGTVCTSQTEGATPNYSVPANTAVGGGSSYADPTEDSRETAIGGKATISISGGKLTTGSLGGGNGVTNLGTAEIKITGGTTSGQFIMAAGASTPPTFTMTGGTILNSSTTDDTYKKVQANGGAVYMEAGTCTISGGTIKGCSATNGGAVYMEGGEFTMSGGTITKNQAYSDDDDDVTNGGAVYVSGGTVKVTGGEISHNYTKNGNGGGVYVTGGSFSMPSGSTGSITKNAANSTRGGTGNGGGIYVASTENDVTADVISGTVTNNTADRNGGGMCVDMSGGDKSATITIGTDGGTPSNPMMSDNSAALSGGGLCVLGTSSNVTINSGTVKGNVSAYVKNEDIRNDGGTVTLNGTTDNFDVKYNTITFYSNNGDNNTAIQRVVTNTNSKLIPPSTAKAWTREFYSLTSWNTKKDGSGTTYDLNGGETMNISSDLNLYAVWTSTGAKRRTRRK